MKILVTGAAGFIGFHISKQLLENGHEVVGIDNINTYYDVVLKYARLKKLGVPETEAALFNKPYSLPFSRSTFTFIRMDLEDKPGLFQLFEAHKFDKVCHLAAQAGVRYSIENPDAYIQANITGFFHILEACRHYHVKHLVYASSSSVYGLNDKIPFATTDSVDQPISLYAASKKSNELMAHTYSHLFGFATTGLRFFTVYGPWGRPDMALFLFTDAIVKGLPIRVFNNGEMARDFTYISDITQGVLQVLEKEVHPKALYKIYNIGGDSPVKLTDFIKAIELNLGKKAIQHFLPMQPGDVEKTWANIDELRSDFGYAPKISVEQGIALFIEWYTDYYKIN